MGYENNIQKNEWIPNEIKFGHFIPFFLFWGGILTPVFTNNILIWIISLIPFYGFILICCASYKDKTDEPTFGAAILSAALLNFLTSVILVIVLFFFLPEGFDGLETSCILALLNVIPSFCFLLFIAEEIDYSSDCTKDNSINLVITINKEDSNS